MNVKILRYYNLLAFLADGITGVLLILCPSFVFKLLGVSEVVSDDIFVRYIGAFVLSTGLCYLIPFFSSWTGINFTLCTRAIYCSTAVVRFCIGMFVVTGILFGSLSLNWIIVACSDLSLCILQIYFLQKLRLLDESN